MIDKLRNLYTLKTIIGLEVSLDLNDSFIITRLKRNNGGIEFKECSTFASVNLLSDYLKEYKNYQISLSVNGRGVLVKSFFVSDLDKMVLSEEEIQQSFPSFINKDFYISQFKGAQHIWIAMVKKSNLDDLLSLLINHQIKPIQVYIGPFVLSNILQYLNVYNDVYLFDKHRIEVNKDKEWIDYSYSFEHINPFNMKIGISSIGHKYIVAYATAFSTLMNDYLLPIAIKKEELDLQFLEEKEKIKFRLNSIIFLSGIFVLLFLNAVLFNHYYQENQNLKSSYSTQVISDKQYQDINLSSVNYENLLKDLGWNGGISKSLLLEKLGLSLNDYTSITLTKIAINPKLENKISNQNIEIVDNRNKLVVSGRVVNLDALSAWLNALRMQQWVSSASITKFAKSEVYDDHSNVFNLEIIFQYEF